MAFYEKRVAAKQLHFETFIPHVLSLSFWGLDFGNFFQQRFLTAFCGFLVTSHSV